MVNTVVIAFITFIYGHKKAFESLRGLLIHLNIIKSPIQWLYIVWVPGNFYHQRFDSVAVYSVWQRQTIDDTGLALDFCYQLLGLLR